MSETNLSVLLEGFSHEELLDLKNDVPELEMQPVEGPADIEGYKNYEPGIITAVLILGPMVITALTIIAMKIRERSTIEIDETTSPDGSGQKRIRIKVGKSAPPSKEVVQQVGKALNGSPEVAKQLLEAVGVQIGDDDQ